MKHLFTVTLAALAFCATAQGQILVNDTWLDGTRNDTAFPAESAWFSSDSSGASLTASSGSMTGTVPSGSVLWLTYFKPGGSPASVGVGQKLTASATFTVTSVAAQNTSRGLRIGLFDFSNGTRVAADGFSTGSGTGAPGANVRGYMLNMNFGTTFGSTTPLQLMERTTLTSVNLMGASGDYTSLGSGPSVESGTAAFSTGIAYTLEFSVERTAADAVEISTRFTGGNLDISHAVTDTSGAVLSFDAFAIRPAGSASVAGSFNFTEFEVAVVPEPSTWAMLVAQLALAGGLIWRRRARA